MSSSSAAVLRFPRRSFSPWQRDVFPRQPKAAVYLATNRGGGGSGERSPRPDGSRSAASPPAMFVGSEVADETVVGPANSPTDGAGEALSVSSADGFYSTEELTNVMAIGDVLMLSPSSIRSLDLGFSAGPLSSGACKAVPFPLRKGVETKDVYPRPVDINRVVDLIEDKYSCNLVERHLHALKRLVKHYQFGFPIKDLVQVFKILNLCAEKVKDQDAYVQPICKILKLCGLPFLKEKSTDESNFAQVVSESISQMGYLLRIPNKEIRLQICDSIMNLFCEESPRRGVEGFFPTSKTYNMEMIEESGVVETLVMGLTLVENQLEVKLRIIKTLQCLSSSSVMNCNLMLNAQAANKICRCMNDPDPSGQLLFWSSEILWTLLEKASKTELVNQLRDFECIHALKEAFLNKMINGYRHSDRQLRNDLLVIATILAENPLIPMVETGFTKQLIMFAVFPEVNTHNPLVRGLKISSNHEDFEMKKLFFQLLVALTNDLASIQLLSEGKALLALFHYVGKNEKVGIRGWSAAQFEELQLHALAALMAVAPLMLEDYMEYQGNTRLLLLLDWCVSQDPYFGTSNSFHATGGHGNKKAQMRYCLKLLRSMASLGEEFINKSLSDQGAINQLIDILKDMTDSLEEESEINLQMQTDILIILSSICENDIHRKELFGAYGVEVIIKLLKIDPMKFSSGMGHNKLILTTVDCIWSCIVGCYTAEDSFLEMGGIFLLLDLLESSSDRMHNLILGTLLELCENSKTIYHMKVWRGKNDSTAPCLLLHLWRHIEKEMQVKRDEHGRILDAKKPLTGIIQEEYGITTFPANYISLAVTDVSENPRVKIYAIFCKLGFEDLPGLSSHDYVTLAIVHHYLDLKVGSVWMEIEKELKQEAIHPVTRDMEGLHTITKHYEDVSRQVALYQTEILENKRKHELLDEQRMYAKIQHNFKQRELSMKSWDEYVARTSDYEILKEAKKLQEQAIKSSRVTEKEHGFIFHQPEIAGLQTTGFWGRLVAIESTPPQFLEDSLSSIALQEKSASIRDGVLKNGNAAKDMKNKTCSIPVK
ncbi:cilia- and flagella-associated protein 69-like [Pristis pectinata]|uniref:cilia- and flagella-associated protein 69-like n=1 Tax=Pristis pectinata TaxID=685728 RepID=UPI00223D9EC2|nr:cilia- and flagella-associated protein 69-like [Pristis pectinata]